MFTKRFFHEYSQSGGLSTGHQGRTPRTPGNQPTDPSGNFQGQCGTVGSVVASSSDFCSCTNQQWAHGASKQGRRMPKAPKSRQSVSHPVVRSDLAELN